MPGLVPLFPMGSSPHFENQEFKWIIAYCSIINCSTNNFNLIKLMHFVFACLLPSECI